MSLRWKLFLFLLAFSLLPMLAVSVIHRQETRALGRGIGDRIRVGMSDIVAHEITQTARDHAVVLARSKNSLEFVTDMVAEQAARGLAREDSGPVPAQAAPDQGPSVVSFHAPAGTPPDAIRQAKAVLTPALPVFAEAGQRFAGLFSTLGVVFETGAGAFSPPRGADVPDGDLRRLPWYQAAVREHAAGRDGCVWSGPVPESPAGRLVFTVSRPIVRPDGGLAGVAFAQAALALALQEDEISSQWSSAMRAYLVTIEEQPGAGKKALRLWAGPESDTALSQAILAGADRLQAGPWLTSEDAPRYADFLEGMTEASEGVTVMSFQGQECFWVYATPLEGVRLVLLLPSRVLAPYTDEVLGEIKDASDTALAVAAAISVLVLLATALGAFWGSKTVTTPLFQVIRAWDRVAAGDFSVRLRFRVRDERTALARAFNETMPKLADHLRLRESLELAQEVQRNLLPKAPPRLPGLDVAGATLPCDETGGDYFDHFPIRRGGRDELAVVVGDVTGHGVSSALLMATARALLRAAGQEAGDADEAPPPWRRITLANRFLAEDVGESGRFMTLLWLEIAPDTGRLRWVRAGHDPAFVVEPGRERARELLGQGLPLGIVPDYVYREEQDVLALGQCLLLGTDGIWEARDASGRMYGKERFLRVAGEHAARPAAAIRDAILADLAAFKAGRPLEDDVTLVVVIRRDVS